MGAKKPKGLRLLSNLRFHHKFPAVSGPFPYMQNIQTAHQMRSLLLKGNNTKTRESMLISAFTNS